MYSRIFLEEHSKVFAEMRYIYFPDISKKNLGLNNADN